MNQKLSKTVFALVLMTNMSVLAQSLNKASLSTNSSSKGGVATGGGDLCEDRIKTVRDDIQKWIIKGGSQYLLLTEPLEVPTYNSKMLAQIQKASIRCVGPNDAGYPVEVNGTPKVCRFDRSQEKSRITCDLNKFKDLSESEQYVLIHHEYAGLADIEKPKGDDSNYQVSNQISASLVDQVVKKLAVIKPDAGFKNVPEEKLSSYIQAMRLAEGPLGSCNDARGSNNINYVDFYTRAQAAKVKTNGAQSIVIFETYESKNYKYVTTIVADGTSWKSMKLEEVQHKTVNVGTIGEPRIEKRWTTKFWYTCQ